MTNNPKTYEVGPFLCWVDGPSLWIEHGETGEVLNFSEPHPPLTSAFPFVDTDTVKEIEALERRIFIED